MKKRDSGFYFIKTLCKYSVYFYSKQGNDMIYLEKLNENIMWRELFMKDMIGYCGLDCEKCDAYIATINDDQALREKTAELWSKLNNAPILPEHINCQGCRKNGVKTVFCEFLCDIRKCAIKKHVATCGECSELENCSTVGAIISNNSDALNNLRG